MIRAVRAKCAGAKRGTRSNASRTGRTTEVEADARAKLARISRVRDGVKGRRRTPRPSLEVRRVAGHPVRALAAADEVVGGQDVVVLRPVVRVLHVELFAVPAGAQAHGQEVADHVLLVGVRVDDEGSVGPLRVLGEIEDLGVLLLRLL